MTRERIEDIREIVLPFVKNVLLKTNYENLGKSDAEEFTRDFNEILDLAIKALEQEPILDKIREQIKSNMYEGEEVYTKADIVAMLTELQLEIEEIEIDVPFGFEPVSKTAAFYEGVSASSKIIQQKIDKLKEAD